MEAIKKYFRKWVVVAVVGLLIAFFAVEVGAMRISPQQLEQKKEFVTPLVDYVYNAEKESLNKLHISSPIDLNYWGVTSYNFSPSKKYLLINIKNIATSTTRLMGKFPGEFAVNYTTKLFNTQSGKEIKTFDFVEPIVMYEFSPDEKILLIAGLKKGITDIIGLTSTSSLHADPSRKRPPIDTGEILQYQLFDIESQVSLKTLENIQAINFNNNNELIVKYDDDVVEKIIFLNKQQSMLNLFGKSIEEIQINATQEIEDLNIIQAMYDVQQNKTLYLGLSTKEILPCLNTIFYNFSPQMHYVLIQQLPTRSIPTQSLQSIVRNIVSGTTGYVAGTTIRALIGGVPGIITGGIFSPIVGYVIGNIVSDVRSISDFVAIKDGKIFGSFKNVVTYEFNPDETRLLILCPEEGWIKLGDTPVYQLFNMETGKKIKIFADVQSAYFRENELIIIKNGKEISYDSETGGFGKKEEKERTEAYDSLSEKEKRVAPEEILPKEIREQKEYERTFPGMIYYALQAIKERGLQSVYETAKELLGKNKPQEELLPTTIKYEYPVEELKEVVVVEEPKEVVAVEEPFREQPKKVLKKQEPEEKFYESAWEQVLDDLSDNKNWDRGMLPTQAWKEKIIESAIDAIDSDQAEADMLAEELYNAYLNEAKRRQSKEVIHRQMSQRQKVEVASIKDLETKAHKIKEDFLRELKQELPTNAEAIEEQERKDREEQELEDIRQQKLPVGIELIESEQDEEIQKQKRQQEQKAEEELAKKLELRTPELEASLQKATQTQTELKAEKATEIMHKVNLEREEYLAEIKEKEEEILKNLVMQGLSQEWQSAIIENSIELIKTVLPANANKARTDVINKINKAIDDYSQTLWLPNKKTILDVKNNIFVQIFNGILRDFSKEFGEFTQKFEEIVDSLLNTENIKEDSGAHWLYDQNEGYFNLNPVTLKTVAEDAAALIEKYGVPIELIESVMNRDLQKVRKGQIARLRSASDLGIMKAIKGKL